VGMEAAVVVADAQTERERRAAAELKPAVRAAAWSELLEVDVTVMAMQVAARARRGARPFGSVDFDRGLRLSNQAHTLAREPPADVLTHERLR